MEGSPFDVVNTTFNLGFSDPEVNLILELQKIHDSTPCEDWECEFTRIAIKNFGDDDLE